MSRGVPAPAATRTASSSAEAPDPSSLHPIITSSLPSSPPPPLRPPSSTIAAKVAHILFNSGSIRDTLQELHHQIAFTGATILGRPGADHIVKFMDTYSTGPLEDFITSAPRTLTPTLVKSDDSGDTYQLGTLSFLIHHNGIGWGIVRIDST